LWYLLWILSENSGRYSHCFHLGEAADPPTAATASLRPRPTRRPAPARAARGSWGASPSRPIAARAARGAGARAPSGGAAGRAGLEAAAGQGWRALPQWQAEREDKQ